MDRGNNARHKERRREDPERDRRRTEGASQPLNSVGGDGAHAAAPVAASRDVFTFGLKKRRQVPPNLSVGCSCSPF